MVEERDRITELRAEATRLRLRAAEHQQAGNALIAVKLCEVAEQFEARADQLARGRAAQDAPLQAH